MLIQSMTWQASVELLARAKVGRLACAHEGQPYITPMSFTYEAGWLYSFSTVGQKITWMRANPLVCVETEELVDRQNWATVIALGRYEELPKTPSDFESHARLRLAATASDVVGTGLCKDRDRRQGAPPGGRLFSNSCFQDHRAPGGSRY